MPAAARGRRPPVTLRDFLEFGCESSSDGFRSYPRRIPSCDGEPRVLQKPSLLRPHIAEAPELISSPTKSPSWSPSAFFFSSPNKSPGSSALARISSSLSRSFSRRISFSFSFWRRREYDEFDDRDSCVFPSPQVSSCSDSSSEYAESEHDMIVIEETSSAHEPAATESQEASSSVSADHDCTDDVPCAAGDRHEAEALDGDPAVGRNLAVMEDKQQLSPVSVLDFPFDDDDGDEERSDAGTCSPSFQHHNCAANLQRKQKAQQPQMVHKIRRFDDGPATKESVVDLEARFTTATSESRQSIDDDKHGRCTAHLPNNSCTECDSEAAKTTTAPRHDYEEAEHQIIIDKRSQYCQDAEEPNEYRLLAQLFDDDTAAFSCSAIDEITEWLLLDFFADGIDRLHRSVAGPVVGTTAKATAALVDAAMDWLRGAGPQWGVGDVMFSGESALRDMERSRRWMSAHEEERQDVAEEVEAFVMDELLDELVTELATVDDGGTSYGIVS